MIHTKNPLLMLLMGALAMPPSSLAATCEAKSDNTTVALLELYTSEGCSSCPPADHWVAELPKIGLGPDRVVPLALHVDYWNDLGWTDRFSQPGFTQRQQDFARRANTRTVYTPEVVLSGREYRRWSSGGFRGDVERINRISPHADITLRLERNLQALRIVGSAVVKQTPANAGFYVALYENNLSTDIRAGENSGRRMQHDFVVHRLIGPFPFDAKGQAKIDEILNLDARWKIADLGVAAFVQALQGTDVLQALALKVCS